MLHQSGGPVPPSDHDQDRRRFLGSAALVAGAAGLLGSVPAGRVQAAAGEPKPAPLREVAGKLALVTGGSSGIGLGMARAFSAAGMKVVLAYIEEEQLAPALQFFREPHAGVYPVRLDVTDRDAWTRAAEEVEHKFGAVHLLCNNAGIGIQTGLARASYKDWDWGMGVNLNGVFNGVHTFLPRMLEHGEGAHIVSTASMSGLLPVGTSGIYNTAKFAVVGMMESLRAEMEGENIGVSVYCPGLVHTNIYQTERNRPPEFANDKPPQDPARAAAGEAVLRDRILPAGMDPLEAGQRVLRGLRNNDLFILSHPEFRDGMQERFDAILASVPQDEVPPATRLAAEQFTMRNPIYARERDRQLQARRK